MDLAIDSDVPLTENELVGKPAPERPDIRSYHYPGWDRTWQEDLEWLNSYDQPVVLDEYAPVIAPCLRGPGEGYGLAIDPGIRDYWGAGYQPFMESALRDRGCIGGWIWRRETHRRYCGNCARRAFLLTSCF